MTLARMEFFKQPPPTVRKANFFHFILNLYDSQNELINIVKASMTDFIRQDQTSFNGVRYKLELLFNTGLRSEHYLDVHLVDSISKEIILYEGQDKDQDKRRVLLTHEIMCSRCHENKSCGNKNETPSDPVIDRSSVGRVKFFMKCNQNCLKKPGNKRGLSRRFQVMITSGEISKLSTTLFVHNNSKHSRTRKGSGFPVIRAICPSEGWTSGGTNVLVIGENFFDGLQVVFGSVIVWSEVIAPQVISAQAPPKEAPGTVDVTLTFKNTDFCKRAPAKFVYTALKEPILEQGFERLLKMIPKKEGDPDRLPKALLLKRAADILETCYPYASSQSGCTYVSNSVPGLPENLPCQKAQNRIIINGLCGPLPSICSTTDIQSEGVAQHFGLPASPIMITGATVTPQSPSPTPFSAPGMMPALRSKNVFNSLTGTQNIMEHSSCLPANIPPAPGLPTMAKTGGFLASFTIPSTPSYPQYLNATSQLQYNHSSTASTHYSFCERKRKQHESL